MAGIATIYEQKAIDAWIVGAAATDLLEWADVCETADDSPGASLDFN